MHQPPRPARGRAWSLSRCTLTAARSLHGSVLPLWCSPQAPSTTSAQRQGALSTCARTAPCSTSDHAIGPQRRRGNNSMVRWSTQASGSFEIGSLLRVHVQGARSGCSSAAQHTSGALMSGGVPSCGRAAAVSVRTAISSMHRAVCRYNGLRRHPVCSRLDRCFVCMSLCTCPCI